MINNANKSNVHVCPVRKWCLKKKKNNKGEIISSFSDKEAFSFGFRYK